MRVSTSCRVPPKWAERIALNKPTRSVWHAMCAKRRPRLKVPSMRFTFDSHGSCLQATRLYTTETKPIIQNTTNGLRGLTDTETSLLPGIPGSAMCVQNLDDSLSSAIRITYRISLRSSSLCEPRYPPLKDVYRYWFLLRTAMMFQFQLIVSKGLNGAPAKTH